MSITTDVPDRLSGESRSWHQLSQVHAARGETRDAILSMWACDLRALHLLLWENGLGEAPDAAVHVQACAEAVQAGLRAQAGDLAAAPTPRLLIEAARRALAGVFDASVHDLLAQRFRSLDHFDDLRPLPGSIPAAASDRLAGRTPDQLLSDLRDAAADCVAVAHALEGDVEEANRQLWQAGLASYEAHLVEAALGLGDGRLTTAGLRWQLAVETLSQDREAESGHAWWLREQLLGLAGAEAPALDAEFALAGEWPR